MTNWLADKFLATLPVTPADSGPLQAALDELAHRLTMEGRLDDRDLLWEARAYINQQSEKLTRIRAEVG